MQGSGDVAVRRRPKDKDLAGGRKVCGNKKPRSLGSCDPNVALPRESESYRHRATVEGTHVIVLRAAHHLSVWVFGLII